VDALVKRNGNFWQAAFEIAPGDPAVFLIHAGLLLTAGEATRAWQVLTLAKQRPGIPKQVLTGLELLRTNAAAVIQEGQVRVNIGIQRFDGGDRKEALRLYREAVAEWPQNALAHYEIGFTLFVEEEVASGRPVPKLGTVKVNEEIKSHFSAETVRRFALARQHNPLEFMAYQGGDHAVIDRLLPLVNKVLPTWKKIMEADKTLEDAVLSEFSAACQEAGLDDMALASRQLLAARRNRYMPEDLAFLRTSLERLAPGPQVEAIMKSLNRETVPVRGLIAPEQPDAPAQDVSKIAKVKQVRLYVAPEEVPNRVGKDVEPLGRYIKALEKATAAYVKKAPKPEAKGILIAVAIKAGKKSRVWCEDVDGEAPTEFLRGLEKELAKVEAIALVKAPMAFALEVEIWGREPDAFPEFPEVWKEAAKKTKSKLLMPPDEVLQLLWPN
jgi:tetratricopeptide (TPR) repeat protein